MTAPIVSPVNELEELLEEQVSCNGIPSYSFRGVEHPNTPCGRPAAWRQIFFHGHEGIARVLCDECYGAWRASADIRIEIAGQVVCRQCKAKFPSRESFARYVRF